MFQKFVKEDMPPKYKKDYPGYHQAERVIF